MPGYPFSKDIRRRFPLLFFSLLSFDTRYMLLQARRKQAVETRELSSRQIRRECRRSHFPTVEFSHLRRLTSPHGASCFLRRPDETGFEFMTTSNLPLPSMGLEIVPARLPTTDKPEGVNQALCHRGTSPTSVSWFYDAVGRSPCISGQFGFEVGPGRERWAHGSRIEQVWSANRGLGVERKCQNEGRLRVWGCTRDLGDGIAFQ